MAFGRVTRRDTRHRFIEFYHDNENSGALPTPSHHHTKESGGLGAMIGAPCAFGSTTPNVFSIFEGPRRLPRVPRCSTWLAPPSGTALINKDRNAPFERQPRMTTEMRATGVGREAFLCQGSLPAGLQRNKFGESASGIDARLEAKLDQRKRVGSLLTLPGIRDIKRPNMGDMRRGAREPMPHGMAALFLSWALRARAEPNVV